MLEATDTEGSKLPSRNVSPTKLFAQIKGREGPHREKPGTRYIETLMHHFRGNIGSGIFALGEAFKHAGMGIGAIGLVLLGLLNLHCQHQLRPKHDKPCLLNERPVRPKLYRKKRQNFRVLLSITEVPMYRRAKLIAANQVAQNHEFTVRPDYAETVLVCVMDGPERFRNYAFKMKKLCNFFLILTQMGFCCVYVVFLADSIDRMMQIYDVHYDIHLIILFTFGPIIVMSMINNLKMLAPIALLANIVTIVGIIITFYFILKDVPAISRLPFAGPISGIPLFFGTVIFAFEGIGLVLPMYNEMNIQQDFVKFLGVLNVGMMIVISLNLAMGVGSYNKYGEDIKSSVTLNLPPDGLAQAVVILIALGVTVSYLLQMYVAFMIMFPYIYKRYGPFTYPFLAEFGFRSFLVIVTYTLAEIIPYLGLFISLIGAVGGGMLALIFPPLLELCVFYEALNVYRIVKNTIILFIGAIGILSGTYCAIYEIVLKIAEDVEGEPKTTEVPTTIIPAPPP